MNLHDNEDPPRPTLQHRFEYLLLRILGAVCGVLPRRIALGIAWLIGVFAFSVLRLRRDVTLSNIRQAFPEEGAAGLRRIARAAYVNLAVVGMDMLRVRYLDREKVLSLVRLDPESESLYRRLMEDGRGLISTTAHYGTWELLGARVAALGEPSIAIVQPQRNPLVDRDLKRVRAKLGLEVVDRRGASREVVRTLNQGGSVMILADQDAGIRYGAFMDFFGKPAATHTGPAHFAVRSGAPMIAGWIHREGSNYSAGIDRLDEEALAGLTPDADEQTRVERLTEMYLHWLEDLIRKDPGQYLWQHRRWKTRPEGEGGQV